MNFKESSFIPTLESTLSWIKFPLIGTKHDLHSDYFWGKNKLDLLDILNDSIKEFHWFFSHIFSKLVGATECNLVHFDVHAPV